MIKKMLMGASISLFAITASAADLTLINNESLQIQVNCNGMSGVPIPAAQGNDSGKLTLPYFLIAARFDSTDVHCTFTDGTGQQGHAEFVISDYYTMAQIKSYDPTSGGVIIEPTSALTTPVSDITVALNKL